jgi:hypothetical protein
MEGAECIPRVLDRTANANDKERTNGRRQL